MSFLQLEKLRKVWPGGAVAVNGVELAVARGEFVVLLGPSGCGKTTTLRMVAGLELPSGGTIRLGGRDITRLPASERDIGMVFQFYALYPHLTVAENIAFPLECAGVPRAERLALARALAERLELTALLERRPRALSGSSLCIHARMVPLWSWAPTSLWWQITGIDAAARSCSCALVGPSHKPT